jgi:peptidylglycine monooxygenase
MVLCDRQFSQHLLNLTTASSPNASMHTAHHMLIYGCTDPGSDSESVWNCGEMMSSASDGAAAASPCKTGSQIIYAWAKNAPRLELPDEVAFRSVKFVIFTLD